MDRIEKEYPSVAFYFQLKIDNEIYSFKEVSGITMEMNTEKMVEGGENRFKHKVPTAAKYQDLVLKRGLIQKESKLMTWITNTLEQGLSNPIKTKTLDVSLVNEEGKPLKAWNFVNAWPIKWEAADLNTENNEVIIESVSFSYNFFNVSR